jgi:hypothetical protein
VLLNKFNVVTHELVHSIPFSFANDVKAMQQQNRNPKLSFECPTPTPILFMKQPPEQIVCFNAQVFQDATGGHSDAVVKPLAFAPGDDLTRLLPMTGSMFDALWNEARSLNCSKPQAISSNPTLLGALVVAEYDVFVKRVPSAANELTGAADGATGQRQGQAQAVSQ